MKDDKTGYEITIIGVWYKCNKYENLPVFKEGISMFISKMKAKKEKGNFRKSL